MAEQDMHRDRLPGNHGQFGEGNATESYRRLGNHEGRTEDAGSQQASALADEELARRHGVSVEAVHVLRTALQRGGFGQAQFSHPELGGMGQWSSGGMIQIGDMFNAGLRDRVAALCAEMASHPTRVPASERPRAVREWWPDGLGQPSATGAQGGMQYACFPDARRVAIEQAGVVTLYDSGARHITGVSQSQGSTQELVFSSAEGDVRASELPVAR